MNEYYQDDIPVCINLDVHNELLEAQFGAGIAIQSPYFDARMIINSTRPRNIQLTIFYQPSEHLFEKVDFLHKSGINILHHITSRPPQRNWDFPDILDFSNSKLLNIEESPHWEHRKKPLILTLDNLDLLYQNRQSGDGRFQLTENALFVLDEYIKYGYLANSDSSDKFIESTTNRVLDFGDIQLELSYNHNYGSSTKYKFEIERDAYLTITNSLNNLSDAEIINRGDLVCTLMSFYWQKTIDFFIAHVRLNNNANYRTKIRYKYSNHYVDESSEFSLKTRYATVYEFIESLDSTKVTVYRVLLEEITPRIIKSKIVDEISEFMLLYNVIEKIRNHCIEFPIGDSRLEIKEEFSFTQTGKALYNSINNKLKELAEIVSPDDRDEFLSKTSGKVNFIKKTGLKDQFDSLTKYLGIDEQTYDLDFTKLIQIRNNIYHGKQSDEVIKPYNDKMRLLIDDLVLKLLQ
ncbi:MAG: hypothetical protein Q8909_03120 [Bacteroidota bacterium]|nr:hypothetical protein [Bacteroidota bacterium]